VDHANCWSVHQTAGPAAYIMFNDASGKFFRIFWKWFVKMMAAVLKKTVF